MLTPAQLGAIINASPPCCPWHDDTCDPGHERAGTDYCCEECRFRSGDSPSAAVSGVPETVAAAFARVPHPNQGVIPTPSGRNRRRRG
jgi:hypothetical protein